MGSNAIYYQTLSNQLLKLMKSKILFISMVFIAVFLFTFCGVKDQPEGPTPPTATSDFVSIEIASVLPFDTHFPTDSNTINSWVANSTVNGGTETNTNMIQHGWAIWHGLTKITKEADNDQKLRTFETWFTPQNIIDALDEEQSKPTFMLDDLIRTHIGHLEEPSQNIHTGIKDADDATAFVKFNPTAANFVYDQKLLYKETLNGLVQRGEISNVPDMPNGSILLKPVFNLLDEDAEGRYSIPTWPGEPKSGTNQTWGSNQWKDSVFVSITAPTNKDANLFNIEDFIYFRLDAAQAAQYNKENSTDAAAGDYVVLAGMHVTTREIKRWTWQTFWWSKAPDTAKKPSSAQISTIRQGANLDRGAKHYAMAIAYNMIQPALPYNRDSNTDSALETGQSIYAYNPYLEAGFKDSVFMAGNFFFEKNGYPLEIGGKKNAWGMQTNCMSCHSQASHTDIPDVGTHYLADAYVGLDDKYFISTVRTDFSWAIAFKSVIKDKKKREAIAAAKKAAAKKK